MDREEVMKRVRDVVTKNGGPAAVARELAVTSPAISQAMNDARSQNDGMRKRVLEQFGFEVSVRFLVQKAPKVRAEGDA